MHSAPEQSPLIRTAREVNDGKIDHVIAQAKAMIDAAPGSYRIACMGLAFKANIDDFRESPAVKVAAALAAHYGDRIAIVEPYTDALPRAFNGTGVTVIDVDEALETCEILIPLVDHDVFKAIPLAERTGKIVYDTRGIWPDQPDVVSSEKLLRLAS